MQKIAGINKKALGHQAADWIRNAIAAGSIAPGTRLTEIGLAEQIGLSRSTVRSAMERLSGEGLLVQHPYSGWEVMSLTVKDAEDLYAVRSTLEALAARLAAENLDDAGREVLENSLAALLAAVESGDRDAIAHADLEVHTVIVDLSGNARLSNHYAQVVDLARVYIRWTNTMHAGSLDRMLRDHRELVALIVARDAAAAEKLAFEHVSRSGKSLVEAMNGSPEFSINYD
ncbi:GntR family transcriptional regulator [Paraburkholderia tropica]|uniref:GntR family transcriptional regulator n=1 Tax=Paraburkholderia TaxID=1822464 RepID=UPI001CB6292B|nr:MULTISPECIES: GntR family transcriptional regulator [Paraburkholderia]CAG9193203.1 GntR family transcriptional regulator [Paraburkholderia tropica]